VGIVAESGRDLPANGKVSANPENRMAKTAAALHILVKEEKLAQEILAKLERASASIIWRSAILNVRPGATAAI
jgi:hypothetical protein